MNKTKIKNFSVWARRNLIEVIAYRMRFLGISENGIAPEMDGSTNKLKLYDMGTSKPAEVADKDIAKRVRLANHIRELEKTSDYKTAYETAVEEIAYTWFNRLIAIRFMEVNDYLPSGVRVLSSESGKREPDIVTNAAEVAEAEGFFVSKDNIWKLKDENKLDELFRIMFIAQCRKLHEVLPELFDNSLDDYTELLLPISFIDDDAFIRHLVTDIDEADFDLSKQGQVEIIGWLYQYYNTEKKDAVFEAMKKNVKVSKENIAPATQLFTPDWIVRYMVENSLGRLWADGHGKPQNADWKYYLDEAKQEESVMAELQKIRAESQNIQPEQIKIIDPCMGSGHILVYAFDVLMDIYTSYGYTQREATQNIVRKNLWGLDIDKRAYQLAYFAVMMKARQYDRRFLTRNIEPNLSHFQDLPVPNYDALGEKIKPFLEQFKNADTYGSLMPVQPCEIPQMTSSIDMDKHQIDHMIKLYGILSQKYDVVCTNPPYMGSSGMNAVLSDFVKKNYPDAKSDLFACFIERCGMLAKPQGYYAMITQHAWMFLSSYEKLREKLNTKSFINMLHLGARAFDEIGGEVVQTTTFVHKNTHEKNYTATYVRLVDIVGENEKRDMYLSGENRYTAKQENFSKIPGSPVAYWVSENFVRAFENAKRMGELYEARKGLATSDNSRFLKLWFEVSIKNTYFDCKSNDECKTLTYKWYPHNKGGEYRKWYGNFDYVINWHNDGFEIRNFRDEKGKLLSRPQNTNYNFKKSLTWSKITSGLFSARICEGGALFDDAAAICYSPTNNKLLYLLGFMNTAIVKYVLDVLNPTLNKQITDMCNLPVIITEDEIIFNKILCLVEDNIGLCKTDWDSFETSWDFKRHPLI